MRRLLNPNEVAAYLGITQKNVLALGILDQIPAIVLAAQRRYDIRDLDRWIDRRKAEQTAWRRADLQPAPHGLR